MSDYKQTIHDLTLMLLYLTSWTEKPYNVRRAWKGYDFDVLDELQGMKLIDGSKGAKSVYVSEEGENRARALLEKYGIEDS